MKKYLLFMSALLSFLLTAQMINAQTYTTSRRDIGNGCANVFSAVTEAPNGDMYVVWRDGSGSATIYKVLKWDGLHGLV